MEHFGFAVEGLIKDAHFEWKKPVWLHKTLHKLGRAKRKCGVTVIDKSTLTGIALVNNHADATGYIDWDYQPDNRR